MMLSIPVVMLACLALIAIPEGSQSASLSNKLKKERPYHTYVVSRTPEVSRKKRGLAGPPRDPDTDPIFSLSDFDLPDIGIPDLELPDIELPDFELPDIDIPDILGGNEGGPTFKERVGEWIDTLGDWTKQATKITEPVSEILDMAAKVKGFFQEQEEAKWAQEKAEREFDQQVQEGCQKICATEWNHWSACSSPCGGGVRTRTRGLITPGSCARLGDFTCPHAGSETQPCNAECANGGRASGDGSCYCSSGFDGKCCDNNVECPYPGKPSNSDVEGKFPARYGQTLTYKCHEGFALNGLDQITCVQGGAWNGEKPECIRVMCNKPSDPPNGQVLNNHEQFLLNEEVEYLCNDGYRLRGPAKQRCLEFDGSTGRWSGFTPLCEEIKCEDPGEPLYGERIGHDFKLGKTVTYMCSKGFRLKGSAKRVCLPSGRWSGHEAVCEAITCEAPEVPKFGHLARTRDSYNFGVRVTYECEAGYELQGSATRQCVADEEWGMLGTGGMWNEEAPKCVGAICPDLDELENGAKDGSVYYYPYNVSFTCFAGYVLRGQSEIMCEKGGDWSGLMPTCEACVEGTYKSNTDTDSSCETCPANTHTVTSASTSLQQCVCDQGYKGPPGGPCVEVICPVLKEPPHGFISDCGHRLGDSCDFSCVDGYIIGKGASRRTCQESSKWSGGDSVCVACPENTYKSDERSCLPCPRNSHTESTGSMIDACVCDAGYARAEGGSCEDADECSGNEGHGPCQDVCRNVEGGYQCDCSISGYIIDPMDEHKCILDQTCRNLTVDDAPENGGLVCHWYFEENSQQCSMKCNPGFAFPNWVNNFERCGPTTEFVWTFEERDSTIPDCVEENFPDFEFSANTTYFVRDCNLLTPDEQDDVKREFAQVLTNQGICLKRTTKVCNMRDVGIICGRTTTRRRRDVSEQVDEVAFNFTLKAVMGDISDKVQNCDEICDFLRVPKERCPTLCVSTFKRFLKAAALYGKGKLEQLYTTRRNQLGFYSAQREFEPTEEGVATSDVLIGCQKGMTNDGELCVPCSAGTYLYSGNNTCVPCSAGTYQNEAKQTQCLPCPVGTFAPVEGATTCKPCPEGRYGRDCSLSCDCDHGRCDAATGRCLCSSGWEGDRCDTDIPGCEEDSCFPGVECRDIPAPGVGFTCGPCPAGTRGDGVRCEA